MSGADATLSKISAEGCWSTIKAGEYLSAGTHRYRIRIENTQTGAIAIGLAQRDSPIGDVVPGSPIVFLPYMWMPDHRMTFMQNLPTRDDPFGRPLRAGDVLDLLLDFGAGTLSVACNGDDLGVAFKQLAGGLTPAISLSSVGDRVTLHGWPGVVQYGSSVAPASKGGAYSANEPPPVYLDIDRTFPNLKVAHKDPLILVIPHFLSVEECQHLMTTGGRYLERSAVVGGQLSGSRTSSTCYLERETCENLVSKAERLLRKPREHFELPQIAHYMQTQEYKAHLDAFDLSTAAGQQAVRNGGQRVGTLLVYLNDCPSGGCTNFTSLNLRIRPRSGTALLFFPCFVDGRVDRRLLHTGEPAVEEKWLAQLWIRQSNFYGVSSEAVSSLLRACARGPLTHLRSNSESGRLLLLPPPGWMMAMTKKPTTTTTKTTPTSPTTASSSSSSSP